MAVNRVIQQHFSMNYSYMERPPAVRNTKSCYPTPDSAIVEVDEAEKAIRKMTMRCGDEYNQPLGLSPPTESELMRRRMQDKPLPVH